MLNKAERLKNFAFLYAIGLSVFLAVIKLITGFVTGSLSIISMGMDSFLDIIFTNLNFYSVRIARKPADEDHPMGHGKFEDFTALIQSIIIFSLGAYIMYSGVKGFFIPKKIDYSINAILVMAFSTLASISIAFIMKYTGKKTKSPALVADSLNYTADIITNGSILIGLIIARYFLLNWMDSLLSSVLSIYIMYEAGKLFYDSFKVLTDYKIPAELKEKVEAELEKHKHLFLSYKNFFAIRSGSNYIINFDIIVCPELNLKTAHDIAEHLETTLKQKLNDIIVTVHLEPGNDCEKKHDACKTIFENLTNHNYEKI